MSILLKDEILAGKNSNTIQIEPFHPECVGPNSYDVRLDGVLLVYDFSQMQYLDCRQQNPTKEIIIREEGFILQPNILYIGNTIESVGSDTYIPMYEGRSSMARLGIESHRSAGFGDVGFNRQWTLEISVIHPVKVYPGMRIGQVYFHRVNQDFNAPENRYNGKYLNQSGPQPSLSFQDQQQDGNLK